MKTACFKLNLENDTTEIQGNNIVLDCTTSGHYCILFNSNKLEECAFVKNKTIKDELIKIHKRFAHPSKAKFKSLLVDTNIWNDEYSDFVIELYEKCEICHRFKVIPPRPLASLSLANDFNDAVGTNLRHGKTIYIFYISGLSMNILHVGDKSPV